VIATRAARRTGRSWTSSSGSAIVNFVTIQTGPTTQSTAARHRYSSGATPGPYSHRQASADPSYGSPRRPRFAGPADARAVGRTSRRRPAHRAPLFVDHNAPRPTARSTNRVRSKRGGSLRVGRRRADRKVAERISRTRRTRPRPHRRLPGGLRPRTSDPAGQIEGAGHSSRRVASTTSSCSTSRAVASTRRRRAGSSCALLRGDHRQDRRADLEKRP